MFGEGPYIIVDIIDRVLEYEDQFVSFPLSFLLQSQSGWQNFPFKKYVQSDRLTHYVWNPFSATRLTEYMWIEPHDAYY